MFQCILDTQPDHLTPSWLIPGVQARGDARSLELNPGITQQSSTLWVPDLATGLQNPFTLKASTWQALTAWRNNRAAIPAELMSKLRCAGVFKSDAEQAVLLDEWRANVAMCRDSMKKGYTPIRGLIHPFQLSALRGYYRRLIRRSLMKFGDSQCPRRYVAHNEPVAVFFHRQLTRAVSTLLGRTVKPSYCYFVGYQGGAELERHVDREQCEYTLALCLDFSPEPVRATPWPLQLQLPDSRISIYQALGDSLLYRGREIPHFRDRLPDGYSSSSLLFHYVDAEFAGPLE